MAVDRLLLESYCSQGIPSAAACFKDTKFPPITDSGLFSVAGTVLNVDKDDLRSVFGTVQLR